MSPVALINITKVDGGGCGTTRRDTDMSTKDRCWSTRAAASFHIQCDIVGAHKGRIELVPRWRWGRCRRWAIGEDYVVRWRLRRTLSQEDCAPGSTGWIGARRQTPSGYVMGMLRIVVVVVIRDQHHVLQEISVLWRLLQMLLRECYGRRIRR